MVINDLGNLKFLWFIRNILNVLGNVSIYWGINLFFRVKSRSIEKLRNFFDRFVDGDKDMKLLLYLFFDFRKMVIRVYGNIRFRYELLVEYWF